MSVRELSARLPFEAARHLKALLETTGVVTLPDFLPSSQRPRWLLACEAALKGRPAHERFFAPFNEPVKDDETDWQFNASSFIMAPGDTLDESSSPWRLYDDVLFRAFLEMIAPVSVLYEYDHPAGALEVSCLRAGHVNAWHFDRADLVVTLMLKKPAAGGLFQMVPRRLCDEAANPEATAALIQRAEKHYICPFQDEGSLTIFTGRHALHRVSPVESSDERICLHLAFAHEPDARLPETLRKTRHLNP